ncbi:PAAR domain-containing protein [Variovorax paradoxus]|jgi:uncharacterized Zn-binding protein involved in type VI secretion|uniref:PAAR domain-containing protein n=1 Tax=Variovorax paradoxus TaxID=34073 RepID=UPI003393B538
MGEILSIIRLGDKTTHGGTVAEAFPIGRADVYEIPAAGLGHLTICPLHPGPHRIAEGVSSYTVDGIPVAVEGMLTTCGAALIPSQFTARVERVSTALIADSDAFHRDHAGHWHSGPAPKLPHDEQFVLLDMKTAKPLANVAYQIKTESGEIISGLTDAEGKTQRITTTLPEQLVFSIVHQGVKQ